MKRIKYVVGFLAIVAFLFAVKIMLGSKVLSNNQTAKQITIVTTTNPIPSIPSTRILSESMKSLYQVPAFRKCKKIIVFDGIQPGYESRESDYEQYKKNVLELTKTSPYFANTELVFCSKWSHLGGAIKEAMERVSTPFVFIHQHDLLLAKKVKVNHLITSMTQNPNIKYVRLNIFRRNLPKKKGGFHHKYDGDVDIVVEGGALVPLCRSFGWSDNDHFARTDYYRNFILPNCRFGAMEWFLHPLFKKRLKENGITAHSEFGTYLYGELSDGKYIKHLDGREGDRADAVAQNWEWLNI